MPYTSRKIRGKNCIRVSNKQNKHIFSKCTTRSKAKKQLRLLRALQFNKNFVPNSKLRNTMKKSTAS